MHPTHGVAPHFSWRLQQVMTTNHAKAYRDLEAAVKVNHVMSLNVFTHLCVHVCVKCLLCRKLRLTLH